MRHTVNLPDDVSAQARQWASVDGVSIDRWLANAVTREVVRRGVEEYATIRDDPNDPGSAPTQDRTPDADVSEQKG